MKVVKYIFNSHGTVMKKKVYDVVGVRYGDICYILADDTGKFFLPSKYVGGTISLDRQGYPCIYILSEKVVEDTPDPVDTDHEKLTTELKSIEKKTLESLQEQTTLAKKAVADMVAMESRILEYKNILQSMNDNSIACMEEFKSLLKLFYEGGNSDGKVNN